MKKTIAAALLVCAGLAAHAQDDGKPVRTYTNDDLDRVAPHRGDTGALSQPGVAKSPADNDHRTRDPLHRGDESYWRREAQRQQEKIAALQRRADDLRGRIDDARRRQRASRSSSRSSARPAAADPLPALERKLQALETEIRERQDAFDERAHRAGALPGWLR